MKSLRECGLFLTVEGGEGVGKSLFCQNLSVELQKKGVSVYVTREPGGTAVGHSLRQIFLEPPGQEVLDPLTEFFLVSAARRHHVLGPIADKRAPGSAVICDRFADSSRVYQGILGGLSEDVLEPLISLSTGGLEPDVTFLLDCDTALSWQRIEKRSDNQLSSRYDISPRSVHEKIRSGFLKVAEKFSHRFEVLDASSDPRHISQEAMRILDGKGLI